MEFLQKRFATRRQPFFEPFRTIAIGARPELGPVFVTTIAPRMRVFHGQEIKIFFPIGTLFLKRRVTKASFYPIRLALGIHARHLHVVQVLVARDDPLPRLRSAIAFANSPAHPDFTQALTK